MNSNVGIQHSGVIAWNGTTAFPRDIRKHTRFGFVFEVVAAVTTDAVFQVQGHDPNPANNCAPGAAFDVEEVAICQQPFVPGALAQIRIPAGTPIGTICAGTIPCRPGAFVSLGAESGTVASIRAVMILDGPMI
jgi:hypothetical protein